MNSSTAAAGSSHKPKPPAADQDAGRQQRQKERQPLEPVEVEVAAEKPQAGRGGQPGHAPPLGPQQDRQALPPAPQHQQGEGRHEEAVRVLRFARPAALDGGERRPVRPEQSQNETGAEQGRDPPAVRRRGSGCGGRSGQRRWVHRLPHGVRRPAGMFAPRPSRRRDRAARPREGREAARRFGSRQLACRDGLCRGKHRTGIAWHRGKQPVCRWRASRNGRKRPGFLGQSAPPDRGGARDVSLC